MPRPTEFVNHLLDLLKPLGDVRARAMFGGWGFYHSEKMFALVASDTFYVKVDDITRDEFERHRLQPFVHEAGGGRHTVLSYHTVPADALDASALLCEWARKGIAAAARRKQPAKEGRSARLPHLTRRAPPTRPPAHVHRSTP